MCWNEVTDAVPCLFPSIQVDGLGEDETLSFLLLNYQAKILESIADKADIGSSIDSHPSDNDNMCSAWQINASKLQFCDQGCWHAILQNIVFDFASALGMTVHQSPYIKAVLKKCFYVDQVVVTKCIKVHSKSQL